MVSAERTPVGRLFQITDDKSSPTDKLSEWFIPGCSERQCGASSVDRRPTKWRIGGGGMSHQSEAFPWRHGNHRTGETRR